MASIIICGSCGRMESWRVGDAPRTHCRFCNAPLGNSTRVSQPVATIVSPTRPAAGRAALRGGLFGAGLGLFITCLYFAFPTLLLLIAHLQPRNADPQGHATALLLKGAVAIFLVPTSVGFLYGTVLMAVVAVTFERTPRLVRAATAGAAYGSVVTSLGELLLVTLSAVIRDQIREPADILIHWTLSLGAAAAGGLVGLLLGLVIGAMLAVANPE